MSAPAVGTSSWVSFNHTTFTYDTPDDTKVGAELVDNCYCLVDVLHVAQIGYAQRKAMKDNNVQNHN